MRKILIIFFCVYVLPMGVCNATPPTSIALSYDTAKGSLHVEAAHPTSDLGKNYVRLMNVYVNGDQVVSQDYYRQSSYDTFTDDVSVDAKAGDDIKVELFCMGGGSLAQDYIVKKAEVTKSDASKADQESGADNSTTEYSNTDNSTSANASIKS